MHVIVRRRGLVVELLAGGVFDSGQATVKPHAQRLLGKIGKIEETDVHADEVLFTDVTVQ